MDKTETEKILNALAAVNDAVRYLNEALGHSDAAQREIWSISVICILPRNVFTL